MKCLPIAIATPKHWVRASLTALENYTSRSTFFGKRSAKHEAPSPSLFANLLFLDKDMDRGYGGAGGGYVAQRKFTDVELRENF